MRKITDHVYQIPLGAVNAFVIEDDGLTLVDTGYKGNADKIFKAIKKDGKDPNDIRRIILTHLHLDHAGSVAEIKRRLNVPVLAHDKDAEEIEKGIAGRESRFVSPGGLNWLMFQLLIKRTPAIIEPTLVDQRLQDGDQLPIAGGIQVIHTPGHSAGHISLWVSADNLVIAGDICANIFGLALSVVYEDRELGIQSIQKVAALDFEKAVFGHGNPIHHKAGEKFRKKFS